MAANGSRPAIVGPDDGPEPPFPRRMEGPVISGFGRGSKELGIPTANIPVETTPWIAEAPSGVYFGYASLRLPSTHPDALPQTSPTEADSSKPMTTSSTPSPSSYTTICHPMVMSIGYNPFYKNTLRSAEVHVLHRFARDFYGAPMRLAILGFVRPERDYDGVEALVADIRCDIDVARCSLDRPAWRVEDLGGEWEWLNGVGGEEREVQGVEGGDR